MKIAILTTGGTIDKYNFDGADAMPDGEVDRDSQVGHPQAKQILKVANTTVDYDVIEVFAKDSNNIDSFDLEHIAEAIFSTKSNRLILTVGTDKLTEVAKYVEEHIHHRTIVVTGAFYSNHFKETDAPFNLGASFIACQLLPNGVYICMNGKVLPASKAVKDAQTKTFNPIV